MAAQPPTITIWVIWESRPTARTMALRPTVMTASVAAERLGRAIGAARPIDTGRGSGNLAPAGVPRTRGRGEVPGRR